MALISAKLEKLSRTLLGFASLVLLATGCDGPNTDINEEISCTEAKGAWLVSKVHCNGQLLENPKFSAVQFTDDIHMDWTLGSSDCQKKVTNVYHLQKAKLDVYGTSFFSCSEDGADTTSCNGMQASCDSSVPGSIHTHNIPKCSIYHGSLKLVRTASPTLSNQGLSFCPPGEEEEIYFTRQHPGSAALTFSTEFGHEFIAPVLPQQVSEPIKIVMTNRGSTDATNISPQIEVPFEFVDSPFPGKDENGDLGTCSSTLPALSECTFYIRFRPVEPGKIEFNMPIHFSNGSGQVTTYFKLSGIGEQPVADLVLLSPHPLDFGILVANTIQRKFVTLRNDGTGPARNLEFREPVPPFFYPETDEFPGEFGTCDSFIGVGEECVVEVEFRPEAPGIFAQDIAYVYENAILYDNGAPRKSIRQFTIKGSAVTAGP